MMLKLQKFALNAAAAMLVFIAGSGVSPNCWWIAYEPEVPECMKR